MTTHSRFSILFLLVYTLFGLSLDPAYANINGFNNMQNWQLNQVDSGTPPNLVNPNLIQLTGGPNNSRSLWYVTPQDISKFQARFIYRAGSISASAQSQGVTFAIHNSVSGLGAVGAGGNGLGYAGISPSIAVTIETNTGGGLTYSGVYTNGVLGGGSQTTTPVNAFTFQEIEVTITYDGSILSVAMVQGANVYPIHNYVVGSIESILGSPVGIVGFTGGTFNTLGAGGGSDQFIGSPSFTKRPSAIPFCFGDTGCPCANDSLPVEKAGCKNGTGMGGKLVGSGVQSVSQDSLSLNASNLTGSIALFWQGSTGATTTYGDGIRCMGNLIRIAPKPTVSGNASYPAPGDQSISARGSVPSTGGVRYYQVAYRSNNGPCATGLNITNGVSVAWGP